MNRKTLLASALTVLMAGSASLVTAQTTPAPKSTAPSATDKNMHRPEKGSQKHHGHAIRHGRFQQLDGGVIGDLRALEKLYMSAGRSKDMTAVYNDVLAKSQDPRVRDYVYHRLARLQTKPANVDQAIATLRKGLEESLANEAKMRAEHEQMRAAWQQHRSPDMTPAPAPAAK